MKFYISDLHIGDKNIIKNCNRPFENLDEMEEVFIRNWNKDVKDKDEVHIEGDLFYRAKKPLYEYLNKLNGKKHLIIGNHDYKLLKDKVAMNLFEDVDKFTLIKDGEYNIFPCHFPMLSWTGSNRGTYLAFGHLHNTTKDKDGNISEVYRYIKNNPLMINVSADVLGFTPRTFEDAIEINKIFKQNN